MSTRISRDAWVLIAFSSLHKLTDLFVGAFLVAYIMRLATNDIVAVSVFRLMEYITLMIGCFAIANWCKVYNKVFVFGLHLIAYVILMTALVVLGDNVINQLFMVGIMYGIVEAFYNFPYNLMVTEKIAANQMARFISIKSAWRNAIRIIAPTILGLFITLGSFVDMARVMLVIICMEFGLLFMLGRSWHRDTKPIDFRGFAMRIMHFPVIRRMFFAEWLRGLADLMGTTITMYTIYIFHTDLNLGIFTTIFSISTILASSLYSNYAQSRHFGFVARLCMLGMVFGVGAFVATPSQITFLIYGFSYATAFNIICHICDAIMFNVGQSRMVGRNYNPEYMAFREFALCSGRWAALILLMYIGVFGGVGFLRWSLIVMGAALIWALQISVGISAKLKNK